MARPQSLAMVDFSLDRALKEEFDTKSVIVLQWLEETLKKTLAGTSFQQKLADGVVLCEIANIVKPNAIRKFHKNPRMLLMKKENIGITNERI